MADPHLEFLLGGLVRPFEMLSSVLTILATFLLKALPL